MFKHLLKPVLGFKTWGLSYVLLAITVTSLSSLVVGADDRNTEQERKSVVPANINAKHWLKRMSQAYRQENYDGVLTYWHSSNQVRTMRVIHILDEGIEYEHLIQLDGDERELVRVGEKVVLMQSGNQLVSMDKSISASNRFGTKAFADDLDRLEQFYQFDTSKTQRVAERKALEILINPKDQYRYGYRLWVDKTTGLLLKSEMVDHKKNVLEGFQFSQLILGDVVKGSLKRLKKIAKMLENPSNLNSSTISDGNVRKIPRLSTHVGPEPSLTWNWELNWLPEGFSLAVDEKEQMDPTNTMVAQMYTDGLAVFSIFIDKIDTIDSQSVTNTEPTQMGPTIMMTKQINNAQAGTHFVTFMGEVPLETAKQITNKISVSKVGVAIGDKPLK